MSGNTSPVSPRNQVQQFSNLGSDLKEKLNPVDNQIDITDIPPLPNEVDLDSRKEVFESKLKSQKIVDLSSSDNVDPNSNFSEKNKIDLEIISPPNFLGIDKEEASNQILFYKAINGIQDEVNISDSTAMSVYNNSDLYNELDKKKLDSEAKFTAKQYRLDVGLNLYMQALQNKYPLDSASFIGVGASAEPICEYIRQSKSAKEGVGNIPLSSVTFEHFKLLNKNPNDRNNEDNIKIDNLKKYVLKSLPTDIFNPNNKGPIVIMDAVDKGHTLLVLQKVIQEICQEKNINRQVEMLSLGIKKGHDNIITLNDEFSEIRKNYKNQITLGKSNFDEKMVKNIEKYKEDVFNENSTIEPNDIIDDWKYYFSDETHIQTLINKQEFKIARVFQKAPIDNILSGLIQDPLKVKHSDKDAYRLNRVIYYALNPDENE